MIPTGPRRGLRFREVAPDLLHLPVAPGNAVNVYLVGDVLVDAGLRFSGRRILRAVRALERERAGAGGAGASRHRAAASGAATPSAVGAHALTHAHPDHQGASAFLCRKLALPLWCGAGDQTAMATGSIRSVYPGGGNAVIRAQSRLLGGPPHPVDRALREGERIGGFTVLETPGHTPGHLSLWRASDRALIAGDVLLNANPFVPGTSGLRTPPRIFTVSPSRNRESARRLAALEPEIVCFGHGPVLRDVSALQEFVETLR